MTPEQIAKLIERNKRTIAQLDESVDSLNNLTRFLVNDLIDVVERQQQLIEYILQRENERQGDGK